MCKFVGTRITNLTMYVFLMALSIFQVCGMEENLPKIIIIGSGSAGIAAASYLLERNLTNIQILEAESKIGGRINSVKFGEGVVDLGAEWCHGEKGNIIYEMVKDLDLLESEKNDYVLYHSSGKPIDADLMADLFDIMDNIETELNDNPPEGTTIGDFKSKRFNEMINEKYRDDPDKHKIAQNALDYFHLNTLTYEGSFSWFDLTASDYYETCEGDQSLNWKGQGFKTIFKVLMKSYPESNNKLAVMEKISFNKEVEKIIWNQEESKIQVKCSDKSSYDGDHVIFTPSVGVLKAKADTMFVPPLPPRKRTAIDNIGFGAVMKIWMYYPDPWWKNTTLEVGFVWDDNDMNLAAKDFPRGPQKNGRSWVTYLTELLTTDYNPTVICAWITGPLVPDIENLTENVMKDGLYYAMNKFLGNQFKVTKPEQILPSKWYNNPNFKGTYSFQKPQTCLKEGICGEDDLAEPLKNSEGRPIILFAGEATHPYYFSTVHGAIETGYREAKTLIDLYK